MISDVTLNFYETANLLDKLFPWMSWQSCLKDIIKGDANGLPTIGHVVGPNGPTFHLSKVSSFALKFAKMNSYSTTDFIEYVLEKFVHRTRVDTTENLDNELAYLLGEITEESAA